ncbi:hypothetical protein ACTPEO_15075 [Clostridioides difficile]|nr:hypothetical protein NZ312_08410 [Clostridioides difficile]
MKSIDIYTKLKIIFLTSMAMFVIGAAFIFFIENYIISIIFVLVGIFIDWKFYRCPNCNHYLDSRMELVKNSTYCPYCGKIIK